MAESCRCGPLSMEPEELEHPQPSAAGSKGERHVAVDRCDPYAYLKDILQRLRVRRWPTPSRYCCLRALCPMVWHRVGPREISGPPQGGPCYLGAITLRPAALLVGLELALLPRRQSERGRAQRSPAPCPATRTALRPTSPFRPLSSTPQFGRTARWCR